MPDRKKPRSPHGTTFRTPYPSYDVLDKWNSPSFDEPTRRVLAARLAGVPPRRFLSEGEYSLLRAVIDTVLPQPERGEAERIAVEAWLDDRLHKDETDGTRHAALPPQRETWRRGLAAIDAEATKQYGAAFVDLADAQRHALLAKIDDGEVDAEAEHWRGLPPKHFFRHVLLKQAVKIYYAHPYAWNEIGFGGPAAPRGYLRLGPDMRDPWEAEEERQPQKAQELP